MPRLTAFAVLAGTFLALTTSSAARPAAATNRTGTIAFLRLTTSRGFGGSLFVVHPDGSGLRQLTPEGAKVWPYAWSPDGKLMAYVDERRSLWLIRPDGSGRRLLLSGSRLRMVDLKWSPGGTRIAVTTACPKARCSTLRLYLVPISGGPPVRLPVGKHISDGVAWSPRGDKLYYTDGGIWAIRPDGTGRRKIARLGWVEAWMQALSADGSQFVFGRGPATHYSSVGVVNADGSGYHIVSTHAYTEYGEAWSPADHRILHGGADHTGIYVIDSDGRNNNRVTRDSPPQADWPALAWSPDGASIAYDAGTYKNTDLYVIASDGSNKVRLTNTPDIDIDPSWVAR
jgi:Tol biopolymer transport system component